MSSSKKSTTVKSDAWIEEATDVEFNSDMMIVSLKDGREIRVPLEWFPRLRDATEEERSNWRLIGNGSGIHWPDMDEDLSVPDLIH